MHPVATCGILVEQEITDNCEQVADRKGNLTMSEVWKIIVADASEDFRTMLVEGLQADDRLEVTGQTGNGAELLTLIQEQMPDGVIMDMMLTELDGLAVLEKLDGERPKVLVLSSFAHSNLAHEVKEAGGDYCMLKPCRLDHVARRMLQLIESPHRKEVNLQGMDLEQQITAIIHDIGVPAHIKGYQYLREAIGLTVQNMEVINAVTKILYPEVALFSGGGR